MCGSNLASAAALVIGVIALVQPRPAQACAAAYPRDGRVSIAAEEAAIVWDEASKTEHFIRRASFETGAKDFGFLVPTPTVPQLAEVPNQLFDALDAATYPDFRFTQEPTEWRPGCLFTMLFRGGSDGSPRTAAAPVRVLGGQRVAGYDAVILEADDTAALGQWLESHGYEARPALLDWVAPYVAGKWKLTAFKVAKFSGAQDGVSTSAVRMSFATERPYYPYREPRDASPKTAAPRSLHIFFIAAKQVEGGLGPDLDAWKGRLRWSWPVSELKSDVSQYLTGLVPRDAWLTAFDDLSSPREGAAELYFRAVPSVKFTLPTEILRGRTPRAIVPVDAMVFVVGLGVLVWRLVKRRKPPPAAPRPA